MLWVYSYSEGIFISPKVDPLAVSVNSDNYNGLLFTQCLASHNAMLYFINQCYVIIMAQDCTK